MSLPRDRILRVPGADDGVRVALVREVIASGQFVSEGWRSLSLFGYHRSSARLANLDSPTSRSPPVLAFIPCPQ